MKFLEQPVACTALNTARHDDDEFINQFESALSILSGYGSITTVSLIRPGEFPFRSELEFLHRSSWEDGGNPSASILRENDCYNAYVFPQAQESGLYRSYSVAFADGDQVGQLERISRLGIVPSLITKAGSNLQAVWVLEEPVEMQEWSRLQIAGEAFFGVDCPHSTLRLSIAGTDLITSAGRRDRVTVVHWDDTCVSPDELLKAFGWDVKSDSQFETLERERWLAGIERCSSPTRWRSVEDRKRVLDSLKDAQKLYEGFADFSGLIKLSKRNRWVCSTYRTVARSGAKVSYGVTIKV